MQVLLISLKKIISTGLDLVYIIGKRLKKYYSFFVQTQNRKKKYKALAICSFSWDMHGFIKSTEIQTDNCKNARAHTKKNTRDYFLLMGNTQLDRDKYEQRGTND